MKFFRLEGPDVYDTSGRPTVVAKEHLYIPAMICPVCGVFSRAGALRVPLPADVSEFMMPDPIPMDEWRRRREQWAQKLKIDRELIRPGLTLGLPAGECSRRIVGQILNPGSFVWVSEDVRNRLEAIGATGVAYVGVSLTPCCGDTRMWELVVSGRAWRRGMSPESSTLCRVCGRSGFPRPDYFEVDECRWDGADIFNLDFNPSYYIVTERIAELLQRMLCPGLLLTPTQ